MKKLLFSTATLVLLTTSASAFNVYPENELNNYTVDANRYVSPQRLQYAGTFGNALLFPLFYTGNGWESNIKVINRNDSAVVAKVVLYSAEDSKELKDFNIYLSGHDEWIGKIVEENGKYYLISSDGSSPLTGSESNPYPMATADNPMKVEIPQRSGYIQVIAMANIKDISANKLLSFHGEHSDLRKIYNILATNVRYKTLPTATVATPKKYTFNNGVILNQEAVFPYITNIGDVNTTYNGDYVSLKSLDNTIPIGGQIRITNTFNGTDLIDTVWAINYSAWDNRGLIYLEGEKANIADATIDEKNNKYDTENLIDFLNSLHETSIYMTYGDTQDVSRNYLLFTFPFKRLIVQQELADDKLVNGNVLDNDGKVLFYDVKYDDTNKTINYGKVKILAQIYDAEENLMSSSQFSPATTPTIELNNEVSTTGTDVNDQSKLPYYLNQAKLNGYTEGYVVITNLSGGYLPGLITQMIATDAGNNLVTNWIWPIVKQY